MKTIKSHVVTACALISVPVEFQLVMEGEKYYWVGSYQGIVEEAPSKKEVIEKISKRT